MKSPDGIEQEETLVKHDDWISALLQQRRSAQARVARNAEHDELATSEGPALLRRLRDRVERDVNTYVAGGGESVTFESRHFRDDGFEVKRDRYPLIFLRVQLEPKHGKLDVVRTWRASTGAQDSRHETTIYLVSKGKDNFYYRLAGLDYADEAAVSAKLLHGLFRFLEDPFSTLHSPAD